ncbi:MAG: thiamine pyrophosphate-dependent enzyme [Candidatus Odinarchaeia archaeon]
MSEVLGIPYEEFLLKGNASCAGCGASLALRHVLKALGKNTILVIPASCSAVIQSLYPFSSIKVPVLNTAFACAAAVCSGLVDALEISGKKNINVVAWAGDGGTFDIGLQALSGAAERKTNMIYFCYDNEAYMNTGIQSSSATPFGAITTTDPITGKEARKKDLESIVLAHNPSYIATATSGHPIDLYKKVLKAKKISGFRLIHILSPCPPGWRYDPKFTITLTKLAVETGMWPLYEIENSKFKLTGVSLKLAKTGKRKRIDLYLKLQGRVCHLKKYDI